VTCEGDFLSCGLGENEAKICEAVLGLGLVIVPESRDGGGGLHAVCGDSACMSR